MEKSGTNYLKISCVYTIRMTDIQTAIRTVLEHIDSISHKITDGEYKNIVDGLHHAYQSAECVPPTSNVALNFSMFEEDFDTFLDTDINNLTSIIHPLTTEEAMFGADRNWVDEFMNVGDLYSLVNHPSRELNYRYLGYSSSMNSVQFRNIYSQNIHNYALGSRRAIWNRVEL